MQKSVKLSKEEVNLIVNALDKYGDIVADRIGYSSGEKYWDIKDKLACADVIIQPDFALRKRLLLKDSQLIRNIEINNGQVLQVDEKNNTIIFSTVESFDPFDIKIMSDNLYRSIMEDYNCGAMENALCGTVLPFEKPISEWENEQLLALNNWFVQIYCKWDKEEQTWSYQKNEATYKTEEQLSNFVVNHRKNKSR